MIYDERNVDNIHISDETVISVNKTISKGGENRDRRRNRDTGGREVE